MFMMPKTMASPSMAFMARSPTEKPCSKGTPATATSWITRTATSEDDGYGDEYVADEISQEDADEDDAENNESWKVNGETNANYDSNINHSEDKAKVHERVATKGNANDNEGDDAEYDDDGDNAYYGEAQHDENSDDADHD